MTTNTVFFLDFIVVKHDDTLIRSQQGIYMDCSNEIRRKRKLYGYDYMYIESNHIL